MKTLCLLLVSTCLFSGFSFAQSTTDAEQVKAVLEQLRHAILQRDRKALEGIYADQFVAIHGNGDLENKASRVERALRANLKDLSFSNVNVRVSGTTAVVTLDTSSVSQNGEKSQGRFLQTWAKIDGQWREVALAGANLSPTDSTK